MISKIKHWYSLGMFLKDDEKRKAQILLIPIMLYWGLSLISLFLNLGWGDSTLTVFLVLGCIFQLVPVGLLFAKKLTASSYAIVVISILFATLFATTGQGIHDYVLMIYPAVIIWAGLTAHRRGSALATLLSLVSFIWLVLGQRFGLFVIRPIPNGDWTDVFVASFLVIVSALAVNLLVSNLERALATVRLELSERTRKETQNQIISEVQDILLHSCEMKDIYRLVSEKARELIGDCITATAIMDEERNSLRMGAFHGVDIPIEKILTLIGFDPWIKEFPLDELTDKDLSVYRNNYLGIMEGGLYALLTREVPKPACLMIEKLLGVQKIYGMGFIHDETHLGGLVILARGDITPYMAVIEQIVNLATIAIERRRAEEALHESESKYRRMVETASEGVIIIDRDGWMTMINQQAASMLGYTIEELHGVKLETLLFEQNLVDHQAQTQFWEQGNSAVYERCFRRKDGSRLWAIVSATAIMDEHNRYDGSFAMFTDITERKQAEDAVQESKRLYSSAISALSEGLIVQDKADKILMANESAARILGLTIDQLLGSDSYDPRWQALREDGTPFQPEDHPSMITLRTGQPVNNTTMNIQTGDGRRAFISINSRPIFDHTGEMTGAVASFTDITERKQAEERLTESEEKFKLLTEKSVTGIYIIQDAKMAYVNPSLAKMFGYTSEEIIGRLSPADLIHPDDIQAVMRRFQERLDGKAEPDSLAYRATKKDGSIIYIEVYGMAINYQGQPAVMGTLIDVTTRKRAENVLLETQLLLSAVVESTDDFIWSVDPERFGLLSFNKRLSDNFLNARGIQVTTGMTPEDLYPTPDFVETWKALYRRALLEGRYKTEYVGKTGPHTMELNFSLLKRDGAIYGISVFGRDITERKQAEIVLAESENRYRGLFEHASIGIFHSLPEGRFLRVNTALARMLGYDSPTEMISLITDIGIQLYEDSQRRTQIVTTTLDQADWVYAENRYRRKDGSIMTANLMARKVLNSDGTLAYLEGFVDDITERKQAENALQRSEAKFRAVLENSNDGILFGDANAKITYRSPSYSHLNGFDDEERLGHNGFETVHPDDKESLRQWWDQVVQQPRVRLNTEYRIKHKDGTSRWINTTAQNLLDHPDIQEIVVNSHDITERVQAEKQIRYQAQLLENVSDAVVSTDNEFNIVSWNRAAEKLYGWQAPEVLGQGFGEIVPTKYIDADRADILTEFCNTGLWQGEVIQQHKNGTEFDVYSSMTALKDQAGNLIGTIAVNRDITERKQAEVDLRQYREHLEELVKNRTAELEIARDQAESANRAKSEFLAMMSHEIRTPLNGVIGNSQLLQQTDLTEKQNNYLTNLQISGESLLAVISDILDFSKIESGRLQLEKTSFDLDEELARLSSNMAHRAWEKGLELVFNTSPEVPLLLVGDPSRLGQVLLNLVGNAIKFTEKGSVTIKTNLLEQTTSQAWLEFSVHDTGIGMTAEQMTNLFKPFTQADSSTTRKYGGTGLGLSISQRLVQIMGGQIRAESQPGEGSNFTFKVSLGCQTSGSTVWMATIPEMAGQQILVVDDNSDALEALCSMLETLACRVKVARSAEDALDLLAQSTPESPYGLVFMDWSLPGVLNGLDVILQMKMDPRFIHIPSILMTDTSEPISQGQKNEIDGTLPKPFTRSQLIESLQQVFGKKNPPPSVIFSENQSRIDSKTRPISTDISRRTFEIPVSHETLNGLSGGHILLVEDNHINQLVASDILQNLGLKVTLANNGEEALEKVSNSFAGIGNGSDCFDAVLMDIQMPGMSGYETTRQIRMDLRENTVYLPIIAMTANAMKGDRNLALDAGMDDYVSKPVNVSQLATVLARWVKPRAASGEPAFAGQKQSLDDLPASFGSIDISGALTRLGNNKELYRRLLLLFHANHAADVQKIRSALQEHDFELARRLAHNMKSLAGTIGADELQVAAKDLEMAIAESNLAANDLRLAEVERNLATINATIARIE